MALEDRMEALTKALDRNSTALEAILAAGGSKAPAADKAADTKAADPKPPKPEKKPKVPTDDDIRSAFGAYLSVKDKGERETRKDNVKAIVDHFGVGKATEIAAESRAEALAYLKQFEAGEKPNFMAEENNGGEDGDSLV